MHLYREFGQAYKAPIYPPFKKKAGLQVLPERQRGNGKNAEHIPMSLKTESGQCQTVPTLHTKSVFQRDDKTQAVK